MFTKRAGLATALAAWQLLSSEVSAQQNGDACAEAAQLQADRLETFDFDLPGDIIFAGFDAKTAYDCLTAISLDADAAVEMIEVIKEYLDFQTTIAYNDNPPESYQQDEVDIIGELDQLSSDVADGAYDNQYDFDIALRRIILDAHDGHLQVQMGTIGLFLWLLPEGLVTVSSDGQEIPEVYAQSDILNNVENASPIVELGGESVFTYLRDYVNRTQVSGLIEPHAEWNQLMWAAPWQFASIATGDSFTYWPSAFEQTYVYNGESISGQFANGSSFEWEYQAGSGAELLDYNLTSAEIIQEQWVQNQETSPFKRELNGKRNGDIVTPLDYHRSLIRERRQSSSRNDYVRVTGYPRDPVVVQDDLGEGGSVSGYIIDVDDLKVGVLSIPTFLTAPSGAGDAESFSEAIADFITEAKDANVDKVVIDLSGNAGGVIFQGFDVFRRFFPNTEPTAAFRTRASSRQNTVGALLSGIIENRGMGFDESTSLEVASQWGSSIPFVSSYSVDLEGNAWDSWEDFYGPNDINGGTFTNAARYNLSSPVIPLVFGEDIAGYGSNTLDYDQPWDAEDIILLQDGFCASTCAIFAELMKTDGGVKSVVTGGIPQYGPMQAVSGTRGSNMFQWMLISATTQVLRQIATFEDRAFDRLLDATGLSRSDVNDLPTMLDQTPWIIRGGALNVLDMVRPSGDDPDRPLQFAYEPADCRLFYTAPMVRDLAEVWGTAAKFANGDDSVCVRESTDAPGLDVDETNFDDPGFDGEDLWDNANSTDILVDENAGGDDGNDSGDSNGGDGGDDDDGAAIAIHASFWGLLLTFGAAIMVAF